MHGTMSGTMSGTITSLRNRGFGFIAPDGGTAGELFFHQSAVADAGFDALREGQAVSFEPAPDPRDPARQRAVHVIPLDAAASPTGTSERWAIREGTDVFSADDHKVGEVVAVQPTYLVVEKGFFFPTDYYVPTSAVATYDGDTAYLNVTKDAALTQGWDAMPSDSDPSATETASVADAASRRTTADLEGEVLRVPVHAEELSAVTREREVGRVEITTGVVAEERVLEVPVTEERVRVERRIVDRDAPVDDATAFQAGTIAVPLRAEEVELRTRTRVAEEIEIGKEAVQRTEQATGTVRREVVDVRERTVEPGDAVRSEDAAARDERPHP
jgi:uncharacterized protein (TIGR02271 family)